MSFHVIIGAGAIGSGTALRLAAAGHTVRVITRSGSGPIHEGIELVAADASDRGRLVELVTGAHSLYNCANPPYDKWATTWPPLAASILDAAEQTGARLVTMSNLYGYAADGTPMSATDPLAAPTRKGAIRVAMWEAAIAAHRAGRVRVTEARASDFFGPGIGDTAHLGDRVMPRLLAGKSIQMVGRSDVVHSWSYVDDVCDTMVILGTDDRALGRAWHVPTGPEMTVQQIADAVGAVAGVGKVKVQRIPTAVIRLAGVFMPVMRELPEMLYQFEQPFVIDAADTTEVFGQRPTPLDEQIRATVAHYATSGQLAAGAGSLVA